MQKTIVAIFLQSISAKYYTNYEDDKSRKDQYTLQLSHARIMK